MKYKVQNAMKKHLLFFIVMSSLFSSTLFAGVVAPQSDVSSVAVNSAPPSFPTAGQAFKKIYSGDLSITDAQTQPWFESYDNLYKKMYQNVSDANITTLLNSLQQNTITLDAAQTQFQAAQTALLTEKFK